MLVNVNVYESITSVYIIEFTHLDIICYLKCCLCVIILYDTFTTCFLWCYGVKNVVYLMFLRLF